MCIDDHSLLNFTDVNGEEKEACVKNFCPQGTKKVTNLNGLTFCKPCEISQCNRCIDVKVKDSKDSQPKIREMCSECESMHDLTNDKLRCLPRFGDTGDKTIIDQNGESMKADSTMRVTFIIQPKYFDPLKINESTISQIKKDEEEENFFSIQ